jgi:hypothetical protein
MRSSKFKKSPSAKICKICPGLILDNTYGAWDQMSQSRPDRPNSATSTTLISVYIQTVTPPYTRRNNKRKVRLSEGNSYITSPTLPKHNRIK